MRITSTKLMNYIRCYRYAALNYHQDRDDDQEEKTVLPVDFGQIPVENGDYESKRLDNPDTAKITRILREKAREDILASLAAAIGYPDKERNKPEARIEIPFEERFTLYAWAARMIETENENTYYLISAATSHNLTEICDIDGRRRRPLFTKIKDQTYKPNRQLITEAGFSMAKYMARNLESGRLLYDALFRAYVFDKSDSNKKTETVLVLLNSEYVRNKLEPEPEMLSFFKISELLPAAREILETDLYRMINHIKLNDDSRCLLVKNECLPHTAFACPYVDFCFEHVPKKNSIFSYFHQHLGFREGKKRTDPVHETYELVNSGMVDMLDVPISWLQRECNLMQRYCVQNDYEFINRKKISDKLESLVYPLYFLDFEAYPSPIPRFTGEKCYTQSVFQFSVHVQKDSKTDKSGLIHYDYVMPSDRDNRRKLVERLLEVIPDGNSSVIVYNQTFEDNRLQELAQLFPVYKERLDNIRDRLFDLLKVLKNDSPFYLAKGYSKAEAKAYNYYHPDLSGSYSLKSVLPVFAEDAYKGMAIANGLEAYLQYAYLPYLSMENRMQIREDLILYCNQDTMSLFVILKGIISRLAE
ncbi:MAG TPA: DUF2779 domain-containing protein [Bacillota bacterium]|nr:DUF2779 domain-containing protein [Bacillota bacterium]HPF42448.1 DUF2779 domain-containing protein [Bacillota bacterium]HPJ85706.1 DUF2779 domain-containing protein [Bacillota bacterium]HPQ61657.1 DUF2779 domain-containing protein [Bacillota bacterium]HRX92049.1 DUF2779 domain-containing protein [Candidatus Izemoplasmatales bacterium]